MTKKALITGVTGQDGSYLSDLLLSKGYIVHGIVRRSSSFNTSRINHLYENDKVMGKTFFTHYGDVTDSNSLNGLVSKIQPDELYNLSAQSHVKVSFEIPQYTAQVDAVGTLNVLDAVHNHSPHTKIYQASTSEMFGGIPREMPRDGYSETSPLHPMSPYGCAKVYAYWISRNYRDAYNMFVSNGLLFNHESPRRGETFVTRKITKWFGNYMLNKHPHYNKSVAPLQLGNLDAHRDWGHAKDSVEAMYQILQQPTPDDFVIATGETHTVREFIELCFNMRNKFLVWEGDKDSEFATCDGEVVIQVNPKYYRPTEVAFLLGNNTKARKTLGWRPKFSFEQLVADMVVQDEYGAGYDHARGEVL